MQVALISSRRLGIALALLLAAFATSRAARAQDWADGRRMDPFVMRANFTLAHDKVLDDLGTLRNDLTHTLGLPTSDEQVELYLFADKASYDRYVSARYPGVPYRRALFVKSGGPGMVYAYRSSDFAVDVRHESTHALLHAVLPSVPLWLDEGLAEYFEVSPGKRASGHPYMNGLKWSARFGLAPGLATLESKRELDEMGRSEYRYSWAWVHFMLHGPEEARQELRGYLADLQTNPEPEPLSRRLARRLPRLEQQFAQHFR